jgi:hypothetical protein
VGCNEHMVIAADMQLNADVKIETMPLTVYITR